MIELLRTRRSIRKFKPEPLDRRARETLEEAILRAPSSRGINPWELVFVDDAELLAALAKAKPHGASFVADAALAIVVCGDETKTDVWVEDCAIASILVQLCAHALGLGSCWVQIRNRLHADGRSAEAHIQELLGIPQRLRVECVIAVGHPAETKPGVAREQLQFDKIHRNRHPAGA